jgi:Ca2+-binding EF-hand superfamily protein
VSYIDLRFSNENYYLDVGKVNFDGFCAIASHFLEEDDSDAMEEELREAFRLYDKEGESYSTIFDNHIVSMVNILEIIFNVSRTLHLTSFQLILSKLIRNFFCFMNG